MIHINIQKTKTKKKSKLLRFALLATAVFVVGNFINTQKQIAEKKAQIEANNQLIEQKQHENEMMQRNVDNYEQFLEQEARNKGYGLPGESIYIEVGS